MFIAFAVPGRRAGSTLQPHPELPLWLEVDLKRPSVRPLSHVVLAVDEYSPSFRIGSRYSARLTTNWRTVRIPVNCRSENGFLQASVSPFAGAFSAGATDTIEMSNFRFYQAGAPHDGKIEGVGLMADAAATFLVGTFPRTLLYTTNLTAARALTLSTAGALIGDSVDVVRADAGAFNLTVNTTLATLGAGTGASFIFDGAAWRRTKSWTV